MANDISVSVSGSFKKTYAFLESAAKGGRVDSILRSYGAAGVRALASATPSSTGTTASSWSYEIEKKSGVYILHFTNSNTTPGSAPVAILIQYGHGTRNGGYVQGRDYINPALKPIFDQIADKAWKAVTAK